jgi:transposase-like protein
MSAWDSNMTGAAGSVLEARVSVRMFSEEFKRDAVDLVVSSGRPIAQVAKELGLDYSTLGNWVPRGSGRCG